jgi:hypothetical protein
MTPDEPGQGQATSYVRGEVVPDEETGAVGPDESGPMTRLRKVASAIRGDRPEQTVPDQAVTTGPDTPDPNGSWPARTAEPGATSTPAAADEMDDGEYTAATVPNDVGAVRSPAAGNRDYWDDADEPAVTEPAATEAGIGEGVPAGRHAAADAGLRPGEATDRLGDFGDIAFGNLLPDAAQYTAQWQQIQFRFVDDPQGSVTDAADVVSQVTAKLEAAIQDRQRAIEERQRAIQERATALRGRWGEGSNADTETLRETLRMYRAFMNQLVGPMP